MDNKKILIITLVVLVALIFYSNSQGSLIKTSSNNLQGTESLDSSVSLSSINNLHEVTLSIEGMYCLSCAYGVEGQIKELDGIVSAKVSTITSEGIIVYDADKVSAEEIAGASTVYPATVKEDIKIS